MSKDERQQPSHAKPFEPLRVAQLAFCVLALAVLALPFVGMIWASTDSTTENRTLAELPSLTEDGGLNQSYLADWGTYFEDHYAYRNELVTANALLRTPLLNSPTDQVVVGTDGWLFYGGTLNDYLGTGTGSDRANRNVAYNLSLVQGYVESYGSEFLFTLAPNKNSLYAGNMPFFYQAGPLKNIDLLEPYLEEYGVNYLDLFDAFEAQSETLYCMRDSHWTNKGAALAADVLLAEAGVESRAYYGRDAIVRNDYQGDLESMLYPTSNRTEENWYYAGVNDEAGWSGSSWSYVSGETVEDAWIETSGSGEKTLLVYRDSFGNALLPFVASASETAYFTKYVPYDIRNVVQVEAESVIIERTERHVLDLATDPPIMPAPSVRLGEVAAERAIGYVTLRTEGEFAIVEGFIPDGQASDDARFYVQIESPDGSAVTYVAYSTSVEAEEAERLSEGTIQESSDYGWRAYVSSDNVPAGGVLRVFCIEGNTMTEVATSAISS